MKKYKIRFYGFGIFGTTEMPFNTEPTVDMIEDTLALHINKRLIKIEQDKFYYDKRLTITYEEIFDNVKKEKEKELVLGSWV